MARLPLKKRKENRRNIEGKRRASKSSSITREIQRLEGGGRYKLADPGGARKKRRIKDLYKKQDKLGTVKGQGPLANTERGRTAYGEHLKKHNKGKLKENTKTTEKDKQDAKNEEQLANLLKNKPEGGYSKENTKDPGPGVDKDGKPRTATLEEDRETNKSKPKKNKKKKKSEMSKEEWLKATRNSPAAKGGFSDEERWAQQEKHRKWKADRAAGKHRKKNLTNAEKLKLRRR